MRHSFQRSRGHRLSLLRRGDVDATAIASPPAALIRRRLSVLPLPEYRDYDLGPSFAKPLRIIFADAHAAAVTIATLSFNAYVPPFISDLEYSREKTRNFLAPRPKCAKKINSFPKLGELCDFARSFSFLV